MTPIIEQVAQILTETGVKLCPSRDGRSLLVRIKGRQLVWTTQVSGNDGGTILTFLSRLPVRGTPERLAAVARVVAGVNYGHRLGGFQICLRTGQVAFCVSTPVPRGAPGPEAIKELMRQTCRALDGDALEVLRVVLGFERPGAGHFSRENGPWLGNIPGARN